MREAIYRMVISPVKELMSGAQDALRQCLQTHSQENSEKKTIKPDKRLSTQAGVRVDRKTPVWKDIFKIARIYRRYVIGRNQKKWKPVNDQILQKLWGFTNHRNEANVLK